jgi:hypothetical protein
MNSRIAFDIGLHLDTRNSVLSEIEIDVRRTTLWACVAHDRFWALYLGRPTSIKSADLEVNYLNKNPKRLGSCQPAGPEKALETQIYELLLDLMELIGNITENMNLHVGTGTRMDQHAYLRMSDMDRKFATWYSCLPGSLKWTPENIQTAPASLFLLHQQYHSGLIHLHRPFAKYEVSSAGDGLDGNESNSSDDDEVGRPDHHFSAVSRAVCTKHAIRISRIFMEYRKRFNQRQLFVTALQHAGTAAIALLAALAFLKDAKGHNNIMQHLECISSTLQDMSYIYQPAERMFIVLKTVLVELRGAAASSTNCGIPSLDITNPLMPNTNRQDFDGPTYASRSFRYTRQNLGLRHDIGLIDPALQPPQSFQRHPVGTQPPEKPSARARNQLRSEFESPQHYFNETSENRIRPGRPQTRSQSRNTISDSLSAGHPEDSEMDFSDIGTLELPQIPEFSELASVDGTDSSINAGHFDFLDTSGGWMQLKDWDLFASGLVDDSSTQDHSARGTCHELWSQAVGMRL